MRLQALPSMDKRFFVALVLTAIVIVAPPLLFPNKSGPRSSVAIGDSTRATTPLTDRAAPQQPATQPAPPPATLPGQPAPASVAGSGASAPVVQAAVETTTVQTRLARYAFSSRGAVPISIALDSYPTRRPLGNNQPSELIAPGSRLSRFHLAIGRDTVALDTVPLRAELRTGERHTFGQLHRHRRRPRDRHHVRRAAGQLHAARLGDGRGRSCRQCAAPGSAENPAVE